MRKGAGAYVERSSTHGPRMYRGSELIDPGLFCQELPSPLEQRHWLFLRQLSHDIKTTRM